MIECFTDLNPYLLGVCVYVWVNCLQLPLSNTKLVKPVSLPLCNIYELLLRDTLAILNKIQVEVGAFPISGFLVKFLINKNFHYSRTSNGIDMKLRPLSKLKKKNVITPKKV